MSLAGHIDIHCHLDDLEVSAEEAVQMALSSGVDRMITIGTQPDDLALVLEYAEKLSPHVYCTLGVHPHEADRWSEEVKKFILSNASRPTVVAIGETGLDYYRNSHEPKLQEKVFRDQIELSILTQLPLEIHTRDAEADTVRILNDYRNEARGVLHCFTGTQWLAEQAIDLGFNISISGIVTFKNAEALRSVVKWAPLDRIHVETDSPYLAPVPERGKKNQPAFVVHTSEYVANLKQVPWPQFNAQMKSNAKSLFNKMNWN
jgi:TatD DNase family protein